MSYSSPNRETSVVDISSSQRPGQVIAFDGTREDDERTRRVLYNDPLMGIFRHVDAGYEEATDCAREQGVKIPMP